MSLPIYSSRDVQVAWSGVPLTGLSPDSFVTFSRNSDLTDEEVGADGQANISRLPDRTGACTISLQQNSPGNIILSGVMQNQEANSSFVTGTLTVSDPSGSVLALLTGVHLKTAPEVSLGSSANGATRDWVFWCEGMKFNSTPEGLADSIANSATIIGGIDTIMANADNVIAL
jgi:hypothetical protein